MQIYILKKITDILTGKRKTFIQARIIHKQIEKRVKKLKKKDRIKIAFIHMYPAQCQYFSLFEKLLTDSLFEPYFIVSVDTTRDKEHSNALYLESKKALQDRYGKERVLDGYDMQSDTFIDYSNDFDMMATNTPYDEVTHKYFKIEYWGKKKVPVFYISYFYMGREQLTRLVLRAQNFIYVWRHFVENENIVNIAKKHQKMLRGKNMVITGYPKMDEYKQIESNTTESKRKKIIIAPHHTIYTDNVNYQVNFNVGAFLQFYETILELPAKYPQIDFIFRPHPLLFYALRTDVWDKKRAKEYYDTLLRNENVIMSGEPTYLELFAESSALIHDCGSYTAEYLYTGKPCAYMYRENLDYSILTPFGRKCIESHYPIYTSEDMYKFIDEVVLGQKDSMKKEREEFAKNEVMINYPHATQKIYEYIKSSVS